MDSMERAVEEYHLDSILCPVDLRIENNTKTSLTKSGNDANGRSHGECWMRIEIIGRQSVKESKAVKTRGFLWKRREGEARLSRTQRHSYS